MPKEKLDSELLFERYLLSQGIKEFEFEKEWEGILKRPDYTVDLDNSTTIFDVKDLEDRTPPRGFSFGDPYGRIRGKIEEGRKQFRPFKDKSCNLVLCSKMLEPNLFDPLIVNGAMYGDIGISIPFNRETGVPGAERKTVFSSHGKMIDDKSKRKQNTTVSSLITLYEVDIKAMATESSLPVLWPRADFRDIVRVQKDAWFVPAVMVFENALARIPLPRNAFTGPCDVRWAHDGEFLFRVFTGDIVGNYYPKQDVE